MFSVLILVLFTATADSGHSSRFRNPPKYCKLYCQFSIQFARTRFVFDFEHSPPRAGTRHSSAALLQAKRELPIALYNTAKFYRLTDIFSCCREYRLEVKITVKSL